jgi:hypothetical protein
MSRPKLDEIAREFEKKLRETEGSDCRLLPFTGNSWIDPLTKWSLKRIPAENQIKWVIVLLDWMPENEAGRDAGSVNANVSYCEDYYARPWTQQTTELKNKTFDHLFMTYWSRALLATEQCLVMNAVWGVRKPTVKAFRDSTISLAKEVICDSIINMVNPERIYVCHSALNEYFPDPRVTELHHPANYQWLFQWPAVEETLAKTVTRTKDEHRERSPGV